MILDAVENAGRYRVLNPGFEKAMAFIMRPDLKELPTGRHDIDGDRVYAIVYSGPGRGTEEALLEIHERYIDIHFVLAGIEQIGWKPGSSCIKPVGGYDRAGDEQSFGDDPDAWIAVRSGSYAIFFPEDAHMPLISPGHLHKVIVKVAEAGAR